MHDFRRLGWFATSAASDSIHPEVDAPSAPSAASRMTCLRFSRGTWRFMAKPSLEDRQDGRPTYVRTDDVSMIQMELRPIENGPEHVGQGFRAFLGGLTLIDEPDQG